jgi:hypothetical protein
MLWGVDEEAFENELATVDLEDHDLFIWRKKGPLGKMRKLSSGHGPRLNETRPLSSCNGTIL